MKVIIILMNLYIRILNIMGTTLINCQNTTRLRIDFGGDDCLALRASVITYNCLNINKSRSSILDIITQQHRLDDNL